VSSQLRTIAYRMHQLLFSSVYNPSNLNNSSPLAWNSRSPPNEGCWVEHSSNCHSSQQSFHEESDVQDWLFTLELCFQAARGYVSDEDRIRNAETLLKARHSSAGWGIWHSVVFKYQPIDSLIRARVRRTKIKEKKSVTAYTNLRRIEAESRNWSTIETFG
jgi:hypothetical protein